MPRLFAEHVSEGPIKFNLEAFEREAKSYMTRKVKPEVQAGFNEIVANWDHKPTFRVRPTVGPNPTIVTGYGIVLDFWVSGPNAWLFRLVSGGAGEHLIPKQPKEDGYLWFRENYDAKTKVVGGDLVTGGSGQSSGNLLRKKQVSHPGFEGREFSRHVIEAYRPRWNMHVAAIMNRARRAARRA